MKEAGRTGVDACEDSPKGYVNSARVQWRSRALGEWRSEAQGRNWAKGPLSAESVPHKQRQNNEG